MLETKRLKCDLCVVGGGLAGMIAAISAAREGISVVLMHERPVLGGNASSEIRMWICGAKGENNRETGILEEILLENLYRNPTKSYAIWDTVLYDFVHREKNIKLLLNCTCLNAEVDVGKYKHGRERKIKTVTGYQMTTQTFFNIDAKYFCDSSGDSILAPLCGAEYRIGREAASEFNEDTTVKVSDSMTMGMSCLIQGRETGEEIKFIPPEFTTRLTKKDFENRNPSVNAESQNYWFLELGGDRDTIAETEDVRDQLVPLALGTWDYVKNSGEIDAKNWDLEFLGFLPGKRESRRMCGEYMVTQRDISDGKVFEDEIAYGGWPLDDHYPGGFYNSGKPNTNVPTPETYSLPYRALYSKNVDNLFFAGRNISMTHMAMSSIRVMATCALLGEAVGKAAAVATRFDLCPHDVYLQKISVVQELLMNEDCFLPSKVRTISKDCQNATLVGASENIRNGQDRYHARYQINNDSEQINQVATGTEIVYKFTKKNVNKIHVVFDSDLNRRTLTGSIVERTRPTKAMYRLGRSQTHLPKTLCRAFELWGEIDDKKIPILTVENNRKRSYDVKLGCVLEKIVLKPTSSWGEEYIPVISFDFC